MPISQTVIKLFSHHENPASLRGKLRAKRIRPLLQKIETVYQCKGSVRIVDVGGTLRYWGIVPAHFLQDHQVTITLVNLPGATLPADQGPCRFVAADACDLRQFADKSFDIAHSNSVVEHVGDWGRMVQFAAELRRVAEDYFCQTPNFWFPIEPHCLTPFFHWLPKPTRLWLMTHFRLGHFRQATSIDEAMRNVESARLLNKKMLQALFPTATIVTERWLSLPKSLIAIPTPNSAAAPEMHRAPRGAGGMPPPADSTHTSMWS